MPGTEKDAAGGRPFKLFPPELEFVQAITDGKASSRTFTVIVQNLRQRILSLRFSPPKTKAWRLLGTQPVVHVAGGLEFKFQVEFAPPEKDESFVDAEQLEDYHDRAMVLCPDYKVELGLHALLPKPGLQVEADLDLGLQAINTSVTRTITLRNSGHTEAEFKIEPVVPGLDIKVEPESGTLAPQESLQVEATFSFTDVGVVSEDLVIIGSGAVAHKRNNRVRVGCTVIRHEFQIMEQGGALMGELKCGSLNFRDAKEFHLDLLNNGPTPVNFRGFILTKEDSLLKAQMDQLRASEEEGADVASYMMAAKLRKLTSSNRPKAFTMSPETGYIEPFSTHKVTVKFHPQDAPPETGFRAKAVPPESVAQDYEYIATFDFEGHGPSLASLPVTGRGVKALVEVGPRTDIDFGDLFTHGWADFPLTINNKQSELPVYLKASRSSYFVCSPSKSMIPPLSTLPVMVRYKPKTLGSHKEELSLTLTSSSGYVLDKVPLNVRGTCSRVAEKPPLTGGIDKLPEDFIREPRFADPDNANLDRMTRKQALKFQRHNVFEDIDTTVDKTIDNFAMARTKEEALQTLAHKNKYTDYIRTSRAIRLKKGKAANEGEVNLGLDETKTLKAPHPVAEPVPTSLRTPDMNLPAGSGRPRNRLPMSKTDIAVVQSFASMPETPEQITECNKELTEGEIASLAVGPNVLDFGKISACSVNTAHLAVTNHLSQHILVMVGAKTVEELDKTEVTSMCIPPYKSAVYPIKLSVNSVQLFKQKMEYVINGMHIFSVDVVAEVVPVTLETSEEHLNFAFSAGNWAQYIERTILLDNPHSFDAEFECLLSNKFFSVDTPQGHVRGRSSRELTIRWEPNNTEPGTHLDGMEIVCKGGVQPHKKVHLRGELPEGKLSFAEKSLDFGSVGVGVTLTRSATIKNISARDCNFRVSDRELPHGVKVSPAFGTVPGNDTMEVEVVMQAATPGPLASNIVVDVRGGKSIKIPLKGTAYVPEIDVLEDEFDFGEAFFGSTVRRPLSLKNATAVGASMRVDLRAHPQFTIELPRGNWNSKLYDTCPLVEAEIAQRQAMGPIYDIYVAPKHKLEMSIAFRPTAVEQHAFEMPLVMTGTGAIGEHRRAVTAAGTQPKVVISPGITMDFGTQVVRSTQQKRISTALEAKLRTNLDTEVPFEFAAPSTDTQENGKGVFVVHPSSGVILPGQEVVLSVEFVPREIKLYEAQVPLLLDGEHYLTVELSGKGMHPKLKFETSEVVIPAVPLGQRAEAVFYLLNDGFDNLEVSYRLPADSSRVPFTIELPEGNLIGIARERLPVLVSFTSKKPLGFTARLDFLDSEGKSYGVNISGLSDNSLLSVSDFVDANQGALQFENQGKTGPLILEEATYALPASNLDAVGPLELSPGLYNFLAATTSIQLDQANLVPAMASTRGKQLIELVETLSGKPFGGKTGKLNANKKEAIEQIHGMFDKLLSHMKSHGALLNAVKPHYLLSKADFKIFLMVKETAAAMGGHEDVAQAGFVKELDDRFDEVQTRAYNTMCYQAVKVYVCGRITPKKLLQQPPAGGAAWPPEKELLASNLYSAGESVLLAWASAHYLNRFPNSYNRVRNFDDAFRSGLVIISLLVDHWPALEDRLQELRKNPAEQAQWPNNAKLVLSMWNGLKLPYELKESDLLEARPINTLMLMLYLFQALPQLLPLTSIEFNGKLNETQVKTIELTNPTRKLMAYNVRLEGTNEFSIAESIVKLDPNTSLQFPVSLTPVVSHQSEARLILSSRREGSASPAATLVFNLRSLPRVRSPLKRISCEAKTYELKVVEVHVTNPFQTDVDLAVQLLPEMAEEPPKPKTPPGEDKKRRGNRANSPAKAKKASTAKTDDTEGLKKYPDPFGSDKSRFKLKFGQTDVLKVAYMPWREGTYYCTIMFTSQQHGQFCYELTGSAGPPEPSMKAEFNVQTDGVQTRDVELPFLNKHLEDAKRLFMEKHPSAKRKDQTNLIQAGFQPVASNGLPEPGGVPEVTYTVQQHNPNVEIAAPFVVLHEKPDEAGVTDTIKRPVGSATATGKSGRGGNGVPPNKIRLNLMPRGTGIYPVKVVLTSPYDVRTLLINFNAAVRGRASALSFDSPARKPVTQDIPLVNNGSSTLDVKARVQGGDAFSGPSAVQVPPKQTVPYPLCFCGPTAGEFTGKLELSIVKTGETNTYTLHGVAGEPVPDSHIVLEVAARTELVKKVQVHNPTKMTATFLVYSDLGFVSGREVVQVEGQSSKDYKMHLNPSKSGKYTGSITFASDEGLYVWHTLEVTVNEAAPEDRIQVSAAVRKAVSVILPVANPLPKPTTFDVVYMGPGVMGLPKLEVPASSSTDFEFYFAPLSEGVDMGRVQFINSELGEFWYELLLTGHPPDAVQVPQMRAPLCGRASRVLTVPNPTNEEVMYTVSSSNPRAFSVSTEHIIVPALGEAQFSVEYCPTTLSSAETATIRLNSMAAGQWDYECVGVADLPEVQEEVTMASIPGSSGSGQVVWRNPTAETATIDVSIRPASANEALIPGVFSMIDRRVSGIVLEPSQEVALAVNFSPPDLRNFRALVVLSVQIPSQREPILVKFPVFGAAETPSTGTIFRYSTKARSTLEAPLDVVLAGLSSSSPDDVFGIEIQPPASHRLVVNSALKIVPVSTSLASPKHPLKFKVIFTPQKMFSCLVDFIITKQSGGRWRFEIELESSKPDMDGLLVVEASVGQVGKLPLHLNTQGNEPVKFQAHMTQDSDLDLDVFPKAGTLYPADGKDEEGQAETTKPALTVTYKNTGYGKNANGCLVIETDESEYTYQVKGTITKYMPPDPKTVTSKLTTKQDSQLLAKLKGAAPRKDKNFVAAAARGGTGRRNVGEGP